MASKLKKKLLSGIVGTDKDKLDNFPFQAQRDVRRAVNKAIAFELQKLVRKTKKRADNSSSTSSSTSSSKTRSSAADSVGAADSDEDSGDDDNDDNDDDDDDDDGRTSAAAAAAATAVASAAAAAEAVRQEALEAIKELKALPAEAVTMHVMLSKHVVTADALEACVSRADAGARRGRPGASGNKGGGNKAAAKAAKAQAEVVEGWRTATETLAALQSGGGARRKGLLGRITGSKGVAETVNELHEKRRRLSAKARHARCKEERKGKREAHKKEKEATRAKAVAEGRAAGGADAAAPYVPPSFVSAPFTGKRKSMNGRVSAVRKMT